jgi:hypothetical protein
MAEAMTVETIIEADWQMQGYWTKVRVPLRTAKGSWSDIDVVAYHPERRHFVLCESKVRGPKQAVYAYTAHSKREYGSIMDFDLREGGVRVHAGAVVALHIGEPRVGGRLTELGNTAVPATP